MSHESIHLDTHVNIYAKHIHECNFTHKRANNEKKTSLILIKDLLMFVTVASNSNFLRVGFDKQIHTYHSNGVILIL